MRGRQAHTLVEMLVVVALVAVVAAVLASLLISALRSYSRGVRASHLQQKVLVAMSVLRESIRQGHPDRWRNASPGQPRLTVGVLECRPLATDISGLLLWRRWSYFYWLEDRHELRLRRVEFAPTPEPPEAAAVMFEPSDHLVADGIWLFEASDDPDTGVLRLVLEARDRELTSRLETAVSSAQSGRD